MRKAIAIDFDGCLCENAWPEIGAPNWAVICAAQLAQHEGAALILWTCRNGDLLTSAVEWCREHGLIFDAINENLPERLEHYGSESRKISADEYWDDRAVHIPSPPNAPLTLAGGHNHEIVRCKDCMHLYFKDFSAFCPHRVSACRPEGFCECGERRKPEEPAP